MMKRLLRAAVLATAIPAGPGLALDTLSGERVREVVSGMTIAGGMLDGGPYTEFYGADGEIRGDGYTGVWTVEGDAMCFDYGQGPDCWSVGLNDGEILWIRDGAVLGTGRATAGNINDF